MSERKEYSFSDLEIEIIDGDRGKNYPNKNELSKSGYCPFLNTKNVVNGTIKLNDCDFITKEKDEMLRKGRVYLNDIVLTTRGTVGNIGINRNTDYPHLRINSGMVTLRSKDSRLLNDYLYFFLNSTHFKQQISQKVSGSAQPQLPIRDLKTFLITFPEIEEQRKIVDLLSSVNELIVSLQSTNEKLETYAQTLYRYYFVDFMPFQDGEFKESELGNIPINCRSVQNKELFALNYGKTLVAKDRVAGEYSVVGSAGVIDMHKTYLVEGPAVVIGRKGTCGKVTWIHENCFPIDTTFYVAENKASLYYLYFALQRQKLDEKNSDSAVPGLNRDVALSQYILLPEDTALNEFNERVMPIFELIKDNFFQIKKLQNVRDFLLPRLLSGEITV